MTLLTVETLPTRPGWFVQNRQKPGTTPVLLAENGIWNCQGRRVDPEDVVRYLNATGGFYRLGPLYADERPAHFDVSAYGLEWTPDRRHLLSEITGAEIPAEADRVQMRPNVLADLVLRVATSGRLTAEDTQALREAGVDVTTSEFWLDE